MSNEPLLDIDRIGLAALRAAQLARAVERGDDVIHPYHEEPLPFDEPLDDDVCELCGGDGMISIPVTKSYGRVQVADWYTGPCVCQGGKRR